MNQYLPYNEVSLDKTFHKRGYSKRKNGENGEEMHSKWGIVMTAVKDVCLDAEWVELMKEAKEMGITIEEIQQFFTMMEEKDADEF